MNFRNHTRFPALAFPSLAPLGDAFVTVVLRQTFSFEGEALVLADEQTPLATVDTFEGEPNQSNVLGESDLCPFKPRCDLILNCTAHAPGNQPVPSFLAGLRVWRRSDDASGSMALLLDKRLRVSGPSWFRRRALLTRALGFGVLTTTLGLVRPTPWKRTRPRPIRTLKIGYDVAFGGQTRVLISDRGASRVKRGDWLPGTDYETLKEAWKGSGETGTLAWTMHDANPIGQGHSTDWFLRATRCKVVPAPQVESWDHPVTARLFSERSEGKNLDDPALVPQGFGILGKGWAPRYHLVGTVDEAWIQSDWHLPGDFSFAFWNGAPEDQQLHHLRGDERLESVNLCAPGTAGTTQDADGNTVLSLDLPGNLPYLLVRYVSGEMTTMPMLLDTLNVDLDQRSLVMVWRMILPLEPGLRVLEARYVPCAAKPAWLERGGGPVLAVKSSVAASHV